MKYDVWVPPHMPLPKERDPEALYMPQSYIKDERLNYLDSTVYISLIMAAQFEAGSYGVDELVKEIKTHPDRDEEIFLAFLKKTGKTLETVTDKELKRLPSIPLTIQDVEESLKRLEKYGFIRKED